MDCANLNFSALPNEVRRQAENALNAYSGNRTFIFNHKIFDIIGQLRKENRVFEIELDDEENDIYLPLSDESWGKLLNIYSEAFGEGYRDAQSKILSSTKNSDEQFFMVFSGVYAREGQFQIPTIIDDGKHIVTESSISDFGFSTGRFIAFWDYIFLNPFPFEKLFVMATGKSYAGKGVKFRGTQMHLIELLTAMIANGDLAGTQKEIAEAFSIFFDIELTNIYKYKGDLNKRNAGNEPKYLDDLKAALLRELQK